MAVIMLVEHETKGSYALSVAERPVAGQGGGVGATAARSLGDFSCPLIVAV